VFVWKQTYANSWLFFAHSFQWNVEFFPLKIEFG